MAFTFVKLSARNNPNDGLTEWIVPAICKGDEAKVFADVWEAFDWAEYRCDTYNDSSPHRKLPVINGVTYTAKNATVSLGEKARGRLGLENKVISLTVYNIRRVTSTGRTSTFFGTVIHQGEAASVNYVGRTSVFQSAPFPDNSEWTNGETLKLKELLKYPKNRFKYPEAFAAQMEASKAATTESTSIEQLAERIRKDWGSLGLSMGGAMKEIDKLGKTMSAPLGRMEYIMPDQLQGRSVHVEIADDVVVEEDNARFQGINVVSGRIEPNPRWTANMPHLAIAVEENPEMESEYDDESDPNDE